MIPTSNNLETINRVRAADFLIKNLSSQNTFVFEDFYKLHRKTVEQFKITMLTNDELSKSYHNLIKNGMIEPSKQIESFVRLKKVRSMSGIVVVSILTKPYDCPGNCLYCPTEKGLPKSYMAKEPAVMRAILNHFDPYKQIQNRLTALSSTGHILEKINIRVIGGTWSYYPKWYQTWFIKRCYQAANEFESGEINQHFTLQKAQEINESSLHRIVEISIETRQDYINKDEIKRLRRLGVTKVELGVQSIYDDVLKLNRRGHDVLSTIEATKMLKNAGFKVAYQVMLNLAGATFERDKKMLEEIFIKSEFRPDYLKIYPLAIVKEAPIYELFLNKKIKPYSKEELMDLIGGFKTKSPHYLRIERIIRDIPSDQIVEGGAKISNLRQSIQEDLAKKSLSCRCIRCREVGDKSVDNKSVALFREDYEASSGKEIFLSIESKDRQTLYSILRLRICLSKDQFLPVLKDAAMIREVHTYGPQVSISKKEQEGAQHRGFGKKLIKEAERIGKEEFKLSRIAIISGVGARNYFGKLGYHLDSTYMVKSL